MTASAIAVTTPYPLFNDVDGQPLENGRVWIGLPGLPPKTNPKDIFWDEDLTVPAAQPVATKGGYPQWAATPRRFFCDGDYSILVENRYGAPVYGAQSNNIPSFYAARSVDVCSVRDYGADGTGTNSAADTAAFEAAGAFAATVRTVGPIDYDNVTARVIIPAGKYVLTRPIPLDNCVSWIGDGSGCVEIIIQHTGVGFQGPTVDSANIVLEGFKLTSGGSATYGVHVQHMIRGCVIRDVLAVGFAYSWRCNNTWTNRWENCQSLSPVGNHFYFGTNTGLVWIEGGRFDEATGYGIFGESDELELHITGNAAIQFGRTSAIHIKNANDVRLKDVFIEGNCIDNLTNYHLEFHRDTTYALTGVTMDDVVINNRGEARRNGLGIVSIRNFHSFDYREGWVRNGVSEVPTIGVGVENVNLSINSAADRTAALSHLAWDSQNHVMLRQVARPTFVGGEDMMSIPGSPDPVVRAALNVGLDAIGVALGTSDQLPAIQSYGGVLDLNPHGYDVSLAGKKVSVSATTGEVFGRTRTPTSATASDTVPTVIVGYVSMDCTVGGRSVTLTNFPVANAGTRVSVGKSDGTSNPLTITPASGTINGAATLAITAAYGHAMLISNGTNWFIESKSY